MHQLTNDEHHGVSSFEARSVVVAWYSMTRGLLFAPRMSLTPVSISFWAKASQRGIPALAAPSGGGTGWIDSAVPINGTSSFWPTLMMLRS